ncbi:hypothetical protein CRG98_016658 [Punica granatum]|nr:hypothetical protein CRG98_016658 [Punica granatum]
MANYEFSGTPRLPLFSRSLTMHAVEPPPPSHQSPLERAGSVKRPSRSFDFFKGKVGKLRNLLESPKSSSPWDDEPQALAQFPSRLKPARSVCSSFDKGFSIRLPGTEDRIVVFFTSLRGIRRTFEDCYAVRMIFRGLRVSVDERDVSMDMAYRKELQSVLGEKSVSLPQVFIRGKYVGGADLIKQLYETGELAQILSGFPRRFPGIVCHSCGDVRFVPCSNCSGSRKVFDEDEGILKRCLECNENGLVRCSDCC